MGKSNGKNGKGNGHRKATAPAKIERSDLLEVGLLSERIARIKAQMVSGQQRLQMLQQEAALAQSQYAGLFAELRKRYGMADTDHFDPNTGVIVRSPKSVPAKPVAAPAGNPAPAADPVREARAGG